MLESRLQARIQSLAKALGCISYKLTVPGRRGVPDLLILSGPYALLLEVKVPGGRLSPLQKRELERLQNSGVTAHVVWTYEEAEQTLRDWIETCISESGR